MNEVLAQLFPPSVIAMGGQVADLQDEIFPAEQKYIASAMPKRRKEFTAGRVLVRRALAALGVQNFPLLSDRDRCPLWPEGVIGSVTHTNRWCAVVVARTEMISALGIDMEEPGRVTELVWPKILLPCEQDRIQQLPKLEQARAAAITFSAKEAFYKFQFPGTRRWLGFSEVEILLGGDQAFEAKLGHDQAANGRYGEFAGNVITGFSAPARAGNVAQ